MPRSPRSQPLNTPLHVITRGYFGQPVYDSAESKQRLLTLLTEAVTEHHWCVLNWTIMTNHAHLVLSLTDTNLSAGMEWLIGDHAKWWNARYQSRGHVYMGRYRSIVVNDADHTRSLMRYVDLNAARAGLCTHPTDWQWSGYAANAGLRAPEPFHNSEEGRRFVTAERDENEAHARYRRYVCAKLPAWARQGHELEERPPLVDVLIPGRLETWTEAFELWRYTTGDVAAIYGVTTQTVRDWLNAGIPPRPFPLPPQTD